MEAGQLGVPISTRLPRLAQRWATLARADAWLGLVVAMAAIIRLATLGRQSFWLDEGVSYIIAARPTTEVLEFVGRWDIHPPLYYLLLHLWLLGGASEFWLRLPSALAGIASVWLIGILGRWLIDARTGVVAAGILAISPLHVWYSQEARMYAQVAFLALALVLCLWKALTADRRVNWWWAGVSLCTTLLLYTSTTSLWMLAVINLYLLGWVIARRAWSIIPRWVASQVATIVLFLPWVPSQLYQLALSRGQGFWIKPPTIGSVINLFGDINSRNLTLWLRAWLSTPGETGEVVGASPLQQLAPINLLFIAAVLGVAMVLTIRQRRPAQWLLWCWLLTPVALAFLISQKYVRLPLVGDLLGSDQSVFTVKNLIVVALPYYILTAYAVTRGGRWVMAGGLTVLLCLNLVSYQLEGELRVKEDWRSAVTAVTAEAAPGDVVIFSPGYLESPFAYYLARGQREMERRGYPNDDVGLHTPPATWTATTVLSDTRRVWVVEGPSHAQNVPGLPEMLAQRGQLTWERSWPGVSVRRFDLTP